MGRSSQSKRNKSLAREKITNQSFAEGKSTKKSFFHNIGVHLFLVAIIAIIAYLPSFNANFIWDDHQIIKSPAVFDFENVLIYHDSINMNKFFINYLSRPVAMFTFVLNHKIHDYQVTGYHIFNIAIHILTSFAVYLLTFLLLKSECLSESTLYKNRFFVAFFTALIFSIHPIQTQSVSYLSQRFTSLATFLYLTSLTLYILSRFSWFNNANKKSYLFYALSILIAILSYKTKEIAYTLPFICLLCDIIFFKDTFRKRLLFLAPIFSTLIVFPITLLLIDKYTIVESAQKYLSLRAIGMHQDLSRLTYFYTEIVILIRYLILLFFPVNQSIYHTYTLYNSFFDLPVFLSFTFFTISIAFLIFKIKRTPYKIYYRIIFFGLLWFLITLSIESSFIPLYPMYEHRLYLPSYGVFFAVIAIFTYFVTKQNDTLPIYATIIPIIVVIIFSIATYNRNEIFKNDVVLWESELEKTKYTQTPYVIITNLGLAYFRAGQYDKAINLYNRIIDITPHKEEVYNTLGVIYLKTKQYDKAINAFTNALKINPDMPESIIGLGQCYLETGRINEAIEQLEKGKKSMYPHYMLYTLLGEAYLRQKRFDEAIDAFNRSIKIKPDFEALYIRLSEIYRIKGMIDEARQLLLTAKQYSPKNPIIIQRLKELSN